jgi:hypothetical protein
MIFDNFSGGTRVLDDDLTYLIVQLFVVDDTDFTFHLLDCTG